jgi:FlaG/FlaF family flagellin (archaellin)
MSSTNDNGVSDVVGSMMMLTITIIMTAIIASAIFGMKPPADVPQVSITIKNNDTNTIGGTTPSLDNMTNGSGTLTLNSDYNFFTDQFYIYDIGTIILLQNDGAVFKVGEVPISFSSDSHNNLILNLRTVDLQGDYETSGNEIEMIRTCLEDTYSFRGFTKSFTLTKNNA